MSYILHLLPLFYPIFTLQIRIRIHKAPQYGSGSTTLSVELTFVTPPPLSHPGGGRGLAVQLWQPADQRRTQQQDQDHHQADHRHGTGTYIHYTVYSIQYSGTMLWIHLH